MARSRPRNEAVYSAAYARERARGNTEAYAKRIASGEARGQTKQQSRGKPAQEHIRRRERDIAAGRLTQDDKRWIDGQKRRVNYSGASEAGKARMDAAIEAFKAMTPEERWSVRLAQMQRQKNRTYGTIYAPHYGDELSPLYLSSRSGLR